MTREYIEKEMEEIQRINQGPFKTFYLRHTSNGGNITSNYWGTMEKFESALKWAETSDDRIGDSLPIKLLVLFTDSCVHCWTQNPLWNGVDYDDEDSHVYTNVPLVGRNWFVDPKDWLDIDGRDQSKHETKGFLKRIFTIFSRND